MPDWAIIRVDSNVQAGSKIAIDMAVASKRRRRTLLKCIFIMYCPIGLAILKYC